MLTEGNHFQGRRNHLETKGWVSAGQQTRDSRNATDFRTALEPVTLQMPRRDRWAGGRALIEASLTMVAPVLVRATRPDNDGRRRWASSKRYFWDWCCHGRHACWLSPGCFGVRRTRRM